MKDLLLEIGTEEIPASFLSPAAESLKMIFVKFFTENRIGFGEMKSFYTPRRLALIIKGVAQKQKEEILELQGPPKKYAFDEQGKPTKVAEGFANTNKVKVKDFCFKQTAKGEYVYVKKQAEQLSLEQLLRENFAELVFSLQFPKSMRWQENSRFCFARPVRWLTLLYGDKPIAVDVEGLKSSNLSFTHRIAKKPKVKIENARQYVRILKQFNVMVRPDERKEYIRRQINVLAREVRGQAVEDLELLDEATNICEMPTPILCEFKSEYLELPPIVLITALKTHARSFAIKSIASETLLPNFVTISNTPTSNKKQVAYWYEEAVEARLEDAKFYFEEDLRIGLEKRVEEEKKVVWIENLGTLFDKTSRLEKISYVIAQRLPSINNHALLRAAYLCKADLLTNMVREKEYTSLQGIMGGIYANQSGEQELTGQIISEHYLPKSANDKLPQSNEAAILSIADKLDNIIGAFVINEIPSGSFDRFGLRRQANAIFAICLDKKLFLDLGSVIEIHFTYFNKPDDTNLLKRAREFFTERLNSILLDRGIKYDIANAVLVSGKINGLDLFDRAQALTELRRAEQFEALVIGQKRVNNILKGIKNVYVIIQEMFKEHAETELYIKAKGIENELNELVANHNYKDALNLLLSLRPFIDTFFDKVLVMTEDEHLRNNRLGLLQYLKTLFLKVADLSEIVIQ
ncbi:MAG: glycine--tRNA ligase subunit beta [Candidatus Latescibacteria bacterium]|nr:glycine--tRNA ligase subunit beta [Candidatus Latescibacterota bacterium]